MTQLSMKHPGSLGHPMAERKRKLTDAQVREILRERPPNRGAGSISKRLMVKYEVSEATIVRIWRKRAYSHIFLDREGDQ